MWFTERKLWFWSSWRQFVSSEEATKLFSPRSTTLRRYDLCGKMNRWGERRGWGTPVRLYIPNRAVPDNDSTLEKCFSSRFLAASKGSHPFVDRSEAPVQRCNVGRPAQLSGKPVLCAFRFVGLIKADRSKEADVKRRPLLTLACLDEVFWLLHGRVGAKSAASFCILKT